MAKITPAKRVDKMIQGLKELKSNPQSPESRLMFVGLDADIDKAIQSLERVRKWLVG